MTRASEIIEYMESLQDEEQRLGLMRFFKTGEGDYGEGDEFLGIKVPQTREVVRAASKDIPLGEVPELLMSRWHEVRLCGFLILVDQFERLATKRLEHDEQAIKKRDEIVTLYLQYAEQANNWDLVDLSVYKILGHWLQLPTSLGTNIISKDLKDSKDDPKILEIPDSLDYKREVLDSLATSPCLWKQRMSIVCTWYPSHHGDPSWCLRYSEIHLYHPHDLMHKAVGWMLREMGKGRIDLLRDFLRQHTQEMPRTMLRYAIEKMPETERKQWLAVPTDRFQSDYVVKPNPFAGIPLPDFIDIILAHDDNSDEAMYYLLRQRLNRQLIKQYEVFHRQLLDGYEDIIEDFFLYIREGKDGQNRTPYQSLKRIKNKDSFETWLLKTFRNYLRDRARLEDKILFTTYDSGESRGHVSDWMNDHNHATCPHDSLTDEQKLAIASQLIAYAHQVFYPRGRFIFLRSLLTILNKQKALPDRDMATALGMTYLSYRVMAHRMRRNLSKFRQRILCGEQLQLDEQHQQMAQQIYNDFIHLYPTLMTYYTQSIATLKCADAISQLRQDYYESTGYIVHEPEPPTANTITIVGFWERLNRMLIY